MKTYELLVWLLPHTKKYPKEQRFVMAKRLQEAMLDFQDCLLIAGKVSDPKFVQRTLHEAEGHLARLRVYTRLAYDLKLSSGG